MKTLDLNLERERGGVSRALMMMAVLLAFYGCSDSPTAPGEGGSPAVVVTMSTSPVIAGDLFRLTITPTRPCWDEVAEMEAVISWDAAEFAWVDTPGVTIEEKGDGRITARGGDRDGFSNGMGLAFRARARGSTTDFSIDHVVMRCEGGQIMVFFHPTVRVAAKP